MNDKSIMPWGKWKGRQMADIPADYLLWLYENNKAAGEVLQYIRENIEVLRHQVKQQP